MLDVLTIIYFVYFRNLDPLTETVSFHMSGESCDPRKTVFGVSYQVLHKPACTVTGETQLICFLCFHCKPVKSKVALLVCSYDKVFDTALLCQMWLEHCTRHMYDHVCPVVETLISLIISQNFPIA